MMKHLIGLISDTHGLLRPEVITALTDASVEHIIHAGDVGDMDILTKLKAIAPVTAVRGNVDRDWRLRLNEVVSIGEVLIYVQHIREDIDLDPKAASFSAVITGHTHKPLIETRDGVLYINPGSIGPRRFNLPITWALMEIEGKRVEARIMELNPR